MPSFTASDLWSACLAIQEFGDRRYKTKEIIVDRDGTVVNAKASAEWYELIDRALGMLNFTPCLPKEMVNDLRAYLLVFRARPQEGDVFITSPIGNNPVLAELRAMAKAEEAERLDTDVTAAATGEQAPPGEDSKTRVAEKQGQGAHRMSVVAGFLLGALFGLGFELAVHLIPWEWMTSHKNALPLQIGTDLTLVCAMVGTTVKGWRKWCWGVGVVTLVVTLLTLLGG